MADQALDIQMLKDVNSKNGKPAMRREAAEHLKKSYLVGLRRICGLLQMARSTFYHKPSGRGDEALREALKETALRRRRWGYWMLGLALMARP